MTETRIRELFSEAAGQMRVGPPPDAAIFVDARRSRRRLIAVSVGAVAAATVVVVVAATMVDGSPGGAPATSTNPPTQTNGFSLQCPNHRRAVSTWDAIGPYRRTPLALGTLFTNPIADEFALVQSMRGDTAKVVLFRGNGTAWARLDLAYDSAKGWHPEASTSCPRRFIRAYWQHQDGLFN